jgi:hypothetical protein
MTKLAAEAWEKLQELDDVEQDRLARLILDDIESERRWDELFAKSQDMLAEMAAEARAEFEAGNTDELTLDKLQ